ncbi:MAG: hypothetical protein AMXMBFR67_28430 [Nitrospira sp.]
MPWTSILGCSQSSDVLSAKLNACVIVTEADVELAIGTPVTAGKQQNDRQCLYQAKGNPEESVIVDFNPVLDRDGKSAFQDQRSKADHHSVPGIGDGAFTIRSPVGGVQLTFLKDDALVTLSLSSAKQANQQAAVTNLAKVAASRLGMPIPKPTAASEKSAPVAFSSQWAGDWYGCVPLGLLYGKGHLSLSDRGDWTLASALVMPGTVTADHGRWQTESYQEILHGTYQVADQDSFSTTGILNVNWSRLGKAQAPGRFDPLLWQSFASMPPRKVTVKRLPPVEPKLVGTWEGSAKFVDRQEEFVWLITSANVSEFYKAITQTGRMEADGDRFKLIVPQSKSTPLTVRFQAQDKLELTDGSGASSTWGRSEMQLTRC